MRANAAQTAKTIMSDIKRKTVKQVVSFDSRAESLNEKGAASTPSAIITISSNQLRFHCLANYMLQNSHKNACKLG